MAYKVVLDRNAKADFSEILDWYFENAELAIVSNFIDEYDVVISELEKSPKLYPFYFKQYQKLSFARFPYKVVYLIEGKNVIILAIVHHKRSPSYIHRRIRKT